MNPGDLWNIDRPPGTVTGGGGQTYIDLAGIDDNQLQRFLELGHREEKPGEETREKITINAYTLSDINLQGSITFDPRPSRPNYRINNQHTNRHPAWDRANGFPQIPTGAASAADITNIPNLLLYIVRTIEDKYYAGYINSDSKPVAWPDSLQIMFQGDRKGIIVFEACQEIPSLVKEILGNWETNPNVLMYGPPGTGKTFAMQWLWKNIGEDFPDSVLFVDPEAPTENTFSEEITPTLLMKKHIRKEWLTFHQNFSYEDFVIGLRPMSSSGGIALEPHLGIFMDVAVSINEGRCEQAIIFIDELNRGNVSRIFGQFITFLEKEKRGWDKEGNENEYRLPVPLPELQVVSGKTEEVTLMDGRKVELDSPYYLPFPIYILASMNSVDRAVAPLDTALARRFEKVECGPDYSFIEERYGLIEAEIDPSKTGSWNAKETAILLLRRLNNFIAAALGPDFELGHSYILSVADKSDEDGFIALANAWDGAIFPQLVERFSTRQEQIIEFLKIDTATSSGMNWYPFKYRKASSIGVDAAAIERIRLKSLKNDPDIVKNTLRFLAYDD